MQKARDQFEDREKRLRICRAALKSFPEKLQNYYSEELRACEETIMSDVEELKNELESAVKRRCREIKEFVYKIRNRKVSGVIKPFTSQSTKKMNDRRDRVIQLLNTVESPPARRQLLLEAVESFQSLGRFMNLFSNILAIKDCFDVADRRMRSALGNAVQTLQGSLKVNGNEITAERADSIQKGFEVFDVFFEQKLAILLDCNVGPISTSANSSSISNSSTAATMSICTKSLLRRFGFRFRLRLHLDLQLKLQLKLKP